MTFWTGRIKEHTLLVPGRTVYSCVAFSAQYWQTSIYSIAAAATDVTRVEVALGFHMATTAIHRASSGVVTHGRPATGLRTTVWLI